jgi:glucokinase
LIGIDIGGTHVRVAAVARDGRVEHRLSMRTDPERGPQVVIANVIEQVLEILDASGRSADSELAIGVGVTGPVDVNTGVVTNPYTLTGWPPTDLLRPFGQRFPQATLAIDNDANVAAYGEWAVGAGKGSRRLAMVTIGTGIGAGFLIDGVVQRSSTGQHSEAGHQILDASGPPCYCGARGCWEVLASGTALNARLGGRSITSQEIEVQEIVRQTGLWIGLGLANLCAIFAPDTVVIGGGVGLHLDIMRDVIEENMRRQRVMVPVDVPVLAAQNGDDAGVIGAALMARDRQEGRSA